MIARGDRGHCRRSGHDLSIRSKLRGKTMRFRFSLRLLCVVFLLACFIAAWSASLLRYDAARRAFFEDIKQRGGKVQGPAPGAFSIKLDGINVTDDDLSNLTRFRRDLVSVDFVRTNIDDSHISAISKLTNLSDLGLGGTKITSVGLTRLENALPKCRFHINRLRLVNTSE